MKKTLCILTALLLVLSSAAVPVLAEKPEPHLPFELKAPTGAAVVPADDMPQNTCTVIYGMDSALVEFLEKSDSEIMNIFSRLGYDNFSISAQMDWSIDSMSDWHADELWLTGGLNEAGEQCLGEWAYIDLPAEADPVNSAYVFGYLGAPSDPADTVWHGKGSLRGWSSVVSEGQYVPADGTDFVCMDLDDHTVYVRVRWIVHMIENVDDDTFEHAVVSDWSPVAAIGAEADKAGAFTPYTAETMHAPEVSDLTLTDETVGGGPVVSFMLDVPERLVCDLVVIDYAGGSVTLNAEARINGEGEWKSVQLDKIQIESGRMKAYLSDVAVGETTAENSLIELRASYSVQQYDPITMDFINEFDTPYSETLSIGSSDPHETAAPGGSAAPDPSAEPGGTAKPGEPGEPEKKCSLCGVCPIQPLGVCLFVWIGAVVLLAAAVVTIIAVRKKAGRNSAGRKNGK